jgi:hypothetical protein
MHNETRDEALTAGRKREGSKDARTNPEMDRVISMKTTANRRNKNNDGSLLFLLILECEAQ